MAREKSEHCLMCGIEKTEENTYHRNGGVYLQSICKKCSSIRAREKYVERMSPEQRERMLEKHKQHILLLEKG